MVEGLRLLLSYIQKYFLNEFHRIGICFGRGVPADSTEAVLRISSSLLSPNAPLSKKEYLVHSLEIPLPDGTSVDEVVDGGINATLAARNLNADKILARVAVTACETLSSKRTA